MSTTDLLHQQPTTINQQPTTDSEVLVRVENVSKKFCRSLKKSLWYGVQDIAHELNPFSRNPNQQPTTNNQQPSTSSLRPDEFWAVNDVSFELRRGECLGLIGHNGAGKTTLLKMLNGLIKPDTGRIEMRGRVGALIALGAGFNPILTGRENIFIYGSVLGLSMREIEEKVDEIIDFAEIRDFINAPVQSYSSGMNVRLGFAIASTLSPDILLLDEVLAVGDIRFTIKCLNRVRNLMSRAAVIFVSHNMQFVSSFCSRVMVLQRGTTLIDAAEPQDGISCYFSMLKHESQVSGSGGAVLERFVLHANGGLIEGDDPVIDQGRDVAIDLVFRLEDGSGDSRLRVSIDDETQRQVIGYTLLGSDGEPRVFSPGRHAIRIDLGPLDLNAGRYSFLVNVSQIGDRLSLLRQSAVRPFRVKADSLLWAKVVRNANAADIDLPIGFEQDIDHAFCGHTGYAGNR